MTDRCAGNSARSVIAESVGNRGRAGRFRTYSAGLPPQRRAFANNDSEQVVVASGARVS